MKTGLSPAAATHGCGVFYQTNRRARVDPSVARFCASSPSSTIHTTTTRTNRHACKETLAGYSTSGRPFPATTDTPHLTSRTSTGQRQVDDHHVRPVQTVAPFAGPPQAGQALAAEAGRSSTRPPAPRPPAAAPPAPTRAAAATAAAAVGGGRGGSRRPRLPHQRGGSRWRPWRGYEGLSWWSTRGGREVGRGGKGGGGLGEGGGRARWGRGEGHAALV